MAFISAIHFSAFSRTSSSMTFCFSSWMYAFSAQGGHAFSFGSGYWGLCVLLHVGHLAFKRWVLPSPPPPPSTEIKDGQVSSKLGESGERLWRKEEVKAYHQRRRHKQVLLLQRFGMSSRLSYPCWTIFRTRRRVEEKSWKKRQWQSAILSQAFLQWNWNSCPLVSLVVAKWSGQWPVDEPNLHNLPQSDSIVRLTSILPNFRQSAISAIKKMLRLLRRFRILRLSGIFLAYSLILILIVRFTHRKQHFRQSR